LADKVLATITTSGMSQVEKAKEIYKWTRANIGYVDHSDKSDWKKAAIQGFRKRTGDCFVYFATAQALLNRAGIENQGIVKIDGHHFWSLIRIDNVWHHFDATPRKGDKVPFSLFMLTDAQIEAYSKAHKNSHVWDQTKYPTAP
jgi:transglutaminase/protease-like cytokinesis protein 3